jgi:peptide/nickel transport system permease protein
MQHWFWRYSLTRLIWAGVTILFILVLNFLVTHLIPGDPVQALVGDFPAPPQYVAAIRHDFGLDEPLLVQLWLYLKNLAHGNLGFSFANRLDVLSLVLDRARFTVLLMLPALTLASLAGVVLALAAAPRAGGLWDMSVTTVSLLGNSVPIFWLGQILIVLFAIKLHWLPATGMASLRGVRSGLPMIGDVVLHMILPVASIMLYYLAIVSRVARVSVMQSLQQDFVLTARAKGLSQNHVLWRHILPNALIPVVTVVGYNFGHSLTGAILTESVFAWPGLGNLFITSITNRDYPVLQGIFLFTALTVVVANFATDMVYTVIDPRVRSGGPHG